ncbi:CHAD domain-containing protein [Nostocoides sp. F2B08]|uniref:CHAD domain-containing protein n=1 Tax=Nostocoides sp. F2B08 TaxID=2653936 RepID=UPI00186AF044|nr:CHAD domain-containing protein [Tetrasphaera sp. F2B08]
MSSPPGGLPQPAPATKAAHVVVPLDATAGETFAIAIDSCLDHLRPNRLCWLETEYPDCLHQTRVSTRRLRALFSLMRVLVRDDPVAQEIKVRLRLVLTPLGPARDLDVAIARARDEGWDTADLQRLQTARSVAYARARSALESVAWERVWDELAWWRSRSTWLGHVASLRDGPARHVTDEALDRRYHRIILAGPHLMTMSDHALHRVRIEGKKLRYGCQFFDSLYPEAGVVHTDDGGAVSVPLHFADAVAGLQDTFGLVNDHAVAENVRDDLGLVSGTDIARPSRLECVRAWQRVADLAPFWRVG